MSLLTKIHKINNWSCNKSFVFILSLDVFCSCKTPQFRKVPEGFRKGLRKQHFFFCFSGRAPEAPLVHFLLYDKIVPEGFPEAIFLDDAKTNCFIVLFGAPGRPRMSDLDQPRFGVNNKIVPEGFRKLSGSKQLTRTPLAIIRLRALTRPQEGGRANKNKTVFVSNFLSNIC